MVNDSHQLRRIPIAKFSFRGEFFDYIEDMYEIDGMNRVFGKSGKEIGKNLTQVQLCHNGIPTTFDKIRLRLAVTMPLPPDIEAASGIRTVNRSLSDTDSAKFTWETPADRANLVRFRRYVLDSTKNEWRVLVHDGEEFELYDMNLRSGAIRNIRTRRILKPGADSQVILYRKNGTSVTIFSHRAYMFTFEADNRDADQTEIDHIDGNHRNNDPANLRWASPSENCMYKFTKAVSKQKTLQKFEGDLNTLKQFRKTGWYLGIVDGEYGIVDPDRYIHRVGDFLVTSRKKYPTLKTGGKLYQVHRVVAYVEGIISKYEFKNPKTCGFVVMHLFDDKEDFRPEELKRGTPAENNMARHDNLATTSRKAVRQLDLKRILIEEFPSLVAAARALGIKWRTIRSAIRNNGKCQGKFYFEFLNPTPS